MTYRNSPEPRPTTQSPPIRWRDYLRFWVRIALRTFIHWIGIPLILFVWSASTLPKPEFGPNMVSGASWFLLSVWGVIWVMIHGENVITWAKEKDRLEQ